MGNDTMTQLYSVIPIALLSGFEVKLFYLFIAAYFIIRGYLSPTLIKIVLCENFVHRNILTFITLKCVI